MAERTNITSPVGRIVAGSLYKPNTKDFDGNPLVYKNGADAGKPRVQYFIALAIPKAGEPHWAHTEWGKVIWAVGHSAFPQAAQRPDFSWKIEDGDSMIPNKRNRKPAENEGWKGNWIIKLASSFAPTVYRQEGDSWVQLTQPDAVMPGDLVQVAFSVDGNNKENNPGVYLNPSMVAFRAFHQLGRISFGPNVDEAGFGSAALPAGASLTPPPAILPAALPAAAASPELPPSPPAPPAQPAAAAPPPVPVYPNPGFVQLPPPNPIPVTPAVSPAPPVVAGAPTPPVMTSPSKRMTPAANGVTYEAYTAAGWTDAQLIANGLMVIG